MRSTVVGLAIMLALAGCGGEDRAQTLEPRAGDASESAAPAAGEVEVEADGALTEAQLKAALPTVADVPTGYNQTAAQSPEPEASTTTTATTTTTGEGDCGKRFEELSDANDDADAKAEAGFEKGLGTTLAVTLAGYEEQDELETALERLSSTLNDCRTFSDTGADGSKTDFTIGSLSFPKYGDDTYSYAITAKTPELTVAIDLVLVRVDQTLAIVTQGGLGAADAGEVEKTLTATLKKLETAAK